MQNRRFNVWLPSRIAASHFYLHACHREARLKTGSQILFHAIAGATGQNLNFSLTAANRNNSQIRRCFHGIRNGRNHTSHTILTSKDGINQIILNFFGHFAGRQFHTFCGKADRSFDCRELFIEQVFAIFHQSQQFLFVFSRNGKYRTRFTRNRIAHITTVPAYQAGFIAGNRFTHETYQQLIGIGAPFIDFQSGVSATQALQAYFNSDVAFFGSYFLVFQRSSYIHTAGTTDIQFAFVLRVKIQQDFSVYRTRFQAERTVHTGFFIFSDQCFQRTVFQILCFQYSHDSSYTQSIISAQRSTFGFYPVTVYISFDRIFFKIMNRIIILLRNHIHVCLKNYTFPVFHARSCRFTDNHITHFVYERFQSQAFSEVNQKFSHFLHVSGRTGNLSQRIKMLPHILWS